MLYERRETRIALPHARLHPSAPISIARTSSRPAVAMLKEPVKVSTMISPKSTSETRSIGLRNPAGVARGDGIGGPYVPDCGSR
jgi:hypothetical protein